MPPQSLQGTDPDLCGNAAAATSILTPADEATQPTCGTQKQPTVLIGTPVPGDKSLDSVVPMVFQTKVQFFWPGDGEDVTLPVDDSSVFVIGLWFYFVGFGYLKLQDIPGDESVTLRAFDLTGTVTEGTGVPSNTAFIAVGEPKPDVSAADLDAAVKGQVATQLAAAMAQSDDPVPHWDPSLVTTATAGRLAIWGFNESDGNRRLYYLTPQEADDGYVATLKDAGEDVKIQKLRPASTSYGELGVFELADPLDAESTPRLRQVAPEEMDTSLGDDADEFRLMGFVKLVLSGSSVRKTWKALKKLVFPSSFLESADLNTHDVEVLVSQGVDSDKSRQFRRLAPADGKVLVGSGGKWALQSVGAVFVPNDAGLVSLSSSSSTYAAKSAGEEYHNSQLSPTLPSGAKATHVWVHVRLKFTCEGASNPVSASDAHRSSVGLYLENYKVAEAASMSENSGNQVGTGTDSAMMLVKLDGSDQIKLQVKREVVFDAAAEDTDRVTWEVTQLGFVGNPE